MMNEARECGLGVGISMPMHGPEGELGILSFAKPSTSSDADDSSERARPFVQLLAGHLHEAVRRVSGLTPSTPTPPLSARESDCLRWVSEGKTSWEISQILGISERTAKRYWAFARAWVHEEIKAHQSR